MTLEFRILGPLEVVRDGAPVRLGGALERTLLTLLLLRANTAVERDHLIDELWPGNPPESAVNVVQTYVSHLRKALPPDRLLTRPPGYLLQVERGELDLNRFEELLVSGRRSLAAADAQGALDALVLALALWRGAPLRDVVQDGFARLEAGRLDELRLAALEDRLEAELLLGRHAERVGELDALVHEHPLRERLRAQLMLALYRSGRQPEALAAYRELRSSLDDELGLEPSQGLRDLEGAILRQDPRLDLAEAEAGLDRRGRTVLVACFEESAVDPLLSIAEPLTRHENGELVLLRLVPDASGLAAAAKSASERRTALASSGIAAWATAFTSREPADDALRAARDPMVALALVGALGRVAEDGRLDADLASLLEHAPCDTAVLIGVPPSASPEDDAPVLVPFGGSEHEWAAAELGAWIAKAEGRPLRLAGTAAAADGRRDASRLLASVALLVQHVADVDAEPALAPAGPEGLAELAAEARIVLIGVPDGWPERGIGRTRAELTRRATVPTLLVRGGARPSALAHAEGLTRFTWTISGST